MSDEDRDVDIESDEEDDSKATQFMTQAEKRAHHNALERKRRDHIKESFHSLRDSVPSLQGEKVGVSRAQILKKASEYIQFMRRKNNTHQQDLDDLKKQNTILEQQVRALEKAKATGTFASQSSALDHDSLINQTFEEESEPEETQHVTQGRRKKLKTT